MFLIVLIFGYLSLLISVFLVSTKVGSPFLIYFDLISLMIVPLAPYLITSGVSKSFCFDKARLKLFGDLCIGFAIIAVIIGIINILYGWGEWDNTNYYKNLGTSLVFIVIPLLYALICKYLIVLPMISYIKNK